MSILSELCSADKKKERHATWLELFYDLVYVAAIAQLGSYLQNHFTFQGFLKFVFLFLPIWWAWVGHTMYATRFDTDDAYHRIVTFFQMAGAILLAVFVKDAFGSMANNFALTYFFIRATYIISYLRVYYYIKEARSSLRFLIAGFSLGSSLWLLSVWVGAPIKYFIWAIGLLVDFITPRLSVRKLSKIPVHASHLPERFGLFVIIVLGESIVAVMKGVEGVHWEIETLSIAFFGFVLAVSIWWLYFEYLEKFVVGKFLGAGHLQLYGNLPVYIGLITIAIGIENNIINDPGISQPAIRMAITGGLFMFFVPVTYFQMASMPKPLNIKGCVPDLIFLIGLLALGFSSGFLSRFVFSLICTLTFLMLVIHKHKVCARMEVTS